MNRFSRSRSALVLPSALATAAALLAFLAAGGGAAADSIDDSVNPASSLQVSVRELTLTGLGKANAKTFRVTKPFYTRTFNASSATCGRGDHPIASFTPTAHAGPTATFTVTPLSPGTCTITVEDDGSGTVRVPVVVTALAPSPAP